MTSGSLLEIGLFLVVVAAPLVFTPFTAAPFVDPKLWLTTAGALVLVAARPRVDRKIALAAAGFVAAIALATLLSLDSWWSLISTEARGTGLIGLGVSAVLLCVATGLPDDLRERIPRWLLWTGVVVSVVAIVGRFATIGIGIWRIDRFASTIGHRASVGGFIAVAALAAAAAAIRWREVLALVFLGSGLSVTAARGPLIALFLGLAILFVRTRDWRRVLGVLLPVLLTLGVWTAVTVGTKPSPAKGDLGYSGAARFAELDEGSALQRPQVYKAFTRAWLDDPIFGSGPGTAWHAYLMHVRPAEVRVAGRGFGDTHNIFLELAVTSGSLGLLAFLLLMAVVLKRTHRSPKSRGWAFAAAVAIGVVLCLEPLTITLTPLLFLTAGLAMRTPRPDGAARASRWLAAPLAVGLLLASADFVGSTLERTGATYDSGHALRWSSDVAPWRLLTQLELAKKRAFDARETEPAAARDARQILRAAIDHHGWNPNVRLDAADVELLMDNLDGARRLVAQQLRTLPNDPRAVLASAVLALRAGDWKDAETFARRSLRIDPTSVPARRIIREAAAHVKHEKR